MVAEKLKLKEKTQPLKGTLLLLSETKEKNSSLQKKLNKNRKVFMGYLFNAIFVNKYFQILPISLHFYQKYWKFWKIDKKLALKDLKVKKKKTRAKNSKLKQKTQVPGGTRLFPLPKWR